jgi:putative NADPH-quinone reductase
VRFNAFFIKRVARFDFKVWFADKSEGNALVGKKFIFALTSGGAKTSYHKDGFNHYSIRDLLQPIEQMVELTALHFFLYLRFDVSLCNLKK